MNNGIYDRIKALCDQNGITIAQLERGAGLGAATIHRWKESYPSVDKLARVALYLGVSLDYLAGISSVKGSAESILQDRDIVTVQRSREHMTEGQKERMMVILSAAFDEAFRAGTEGGSDET